MSYLSDDVYVVVAWDSHEECRVVLAFRRPADADDFVARARSAVEAKDQMALTSIDVEGKVERAPQYMVHACGVIR